MAQRSEVLENHHSVERYCQESDFHPKPPVDIGGRPILWHIMKL